MWIKMRIKLVNLNNWEKNNNKKMQQNDICIILLCITYKRASIVYTFIIIHRMLRIGNVHIFEIIVYIKFSIGRGTKSVPTMSHLNAFILCSIFDITAVRERRTSIHSIIQVFTNNMQFRSR